MNSVIKKIVVFFFSMLILIAFVFGVNITKSRDMYTGLSQDDKMLYGFIDSEGSKLGKKYHMHYAGNGIGGMDKVWLMGLSFQRFGHSLNEEEARNLIVNCTIDYLKAVNSDEKLQPFLQNYPFTANNLDIAIYNYDKQGYDIPHPGIRVVGLFQGKIRYFTGEAVRLQYESEKYETYEEALAILKNENHK